MGILIERLWQAQPKELAAGLLIQERYLELKTVSVASVSPSVNFSAVPTGYTRIINGVSWVVLPGAAQTVRYATLSLLINGTVQASAGDNTPYAIGAANIWSHFINLGDGWICRPGDVLQVQANLDLGGVSNTLNATLNGYQFPTGNLL